MRLLLAVWMEGPLQYLLCQVHFCNPLLLLLLPLQQRWQLE
jgi:hypothetical protein